MDFEFKIITQLILVAKKCRREVGLGWPCGWNRLRIRQNHAYHTKVLIMYVLLHSKIVMRGVLVVGLCASKDCEALSSLLREKHRDRRACSCFMSDSTAAHGWVCRGRCYSHYRRNSHHVPIRDSLRCATGNVSAKFGSHSHSSVNLLEVLVVLLNGCTALQRTTFCNGMRWLE